jgi:hypothetical protein
VLKKSDERVLTSGEIVELGWFLRCNPSLIVKLLVTLQEENPELVRELSGQQLRGGVPYAHSIAPCNVINNGFGGI